MRALRLLVPIMILSAPVAARAQDVCAPAPQARPAMSFIWENDAIVGPDRDYSNGLGLQFSAPRRDCAPLVGVVARINDAFDDHVFDALAGPESGTLLGEQLAFGLGHQIYTPEDLTRADPDPADRPYAAWLYYSAAYIRETRQPDGAHGRGPLGQVRALSITQVDLGVVGPWAQGEGLQRGFHDWIDAQTDPQGWDSQIGNEPGVVIRHERKLISMWDAGLIDAEFEWNAGLALGNVMTDASFGLGLRVGYNLGPDYGAPRLRPGLSGSNTFSAGPDGPVSVYLFGAAGARAVARNIFLDGNTFGGGPGVDRNVLVADYQYGVGLTAGWARLSLTRIHRSQEFAGQDRDSVFDSLGVSVRF